MNGIRTGAIALALTILCACSSSPEPFEDDWVVKYQHSYEFMWEQCIAALQQQYRIETADQDSKTLTTHWNETLAVMAHQGFRTRLIITVAGDIEAGYTVKAVEEREVNTEQVNPDSSAEAEWEPGSADGGSLAKFRVALHRRLNPKETWREKGVR